MVVTAGIIFRIFFGKRKVLAELLWTKNFLRGLLDF